MGIHFTHRSGGHCWSSERGYHQPDPWPQHIWAAVTAPAPTKPAPAAAASPERKMHFCWLVELFLPGGNSMGCYHTGFTTLTPGNSRTTRDPLQAKRYATQAEAAQVADGLHHLQGVWRAVEHGFDA
jgi:hypothetical protein